MGWSFEDCFPVAAGAAGVASVGFASPRSFPLVAIKAPRFGVVVSALTPLPRSTWTTLGSKAEVGDRMRA